MATGDMTGRAPSVLYGGWFWIDNSNSGIDATLRSLYSGKGSIAPFKVSSSNVDMESALLADVIAESTSANGVTIDGANIKDGFLANTAGGGLVLIETKTFSNDAALNFVTGITGYKRYEIYLDDILPATDGAALLVQITDDAGSTYKTTGYLGAGGSETSGGTEDGLSYTTAIFRTHAIGSTAGEGVSGKLVLTPGAAGIKPKASGTVHLVDNTATPLGRTEYQGGHYATALLVDGFRLIFSAGNGTSGTCSIYGVSG